MAKISGPALTAYHVRSAIVAATVIDRLGSLPSDAHESYYHVTAGGEFPPEQLREGEELLRELGLLIRRGDRLYRTEELAILADSSLEIATEALLIRALQVTPVDEETVQRAAGELIDDPKRREAFLVTLRRRYNPEAKCELGRAGEEAVVAAARAQLVELGREDLAAKVHRVSLLSDQLGYDVTAPRLDGTLRLLEVKTSGLRWEPTLGFFLSRNEAETGVRFRDWALVICGRESDGDALVMGWCTGGSLRPYLPTDGAQSEWTEARLTIPTALLLPGLPGVV